MDRLEVARDGHGQVSRRRHNPAAWAGWQAPQAPCVWLKWQVAETQQLIGANRQLMRASDNSGPQSAVSGVTEADVASLFSEARAWSPCGLGGQGVRAAAENASLSSEATARC